MPYLLNFTKVDPKKFSMSMLPIQQIRRDTELMGNLLVIKLEAIEKLTPRLVGWYNRHSDASEYELLGDESHDKRKGVVVLCWYEKFVVGYGVLLVSESIGEITSLYLHTKFQGFGWGRKIIECLVEKARTLELESVFLNTRVEFKSAIALYKKLGFKEKEGEYSIKNSVGYVLTF